MAIKLSKKPDWMGYTAADSAIADGRVLGLAGDVEKRITRMARRSAPVTHNEGNRRFGDFVLRVEGKEVVALNRL